MAEDEGTDTGTTEPVDVSVYEAAIAERDALLVERDESIASLTGELTAQKAKNYDLLMQIPSGNDETVEDSIPVDDSETPDIEDFFE